MSLLRFRSAPLRQAAWFAGAFIAFRVVYRVLFDGANGSGALLLELPVVRLPAPFAHVALFGSITADGLWDAVDSALPIAAAILAFGVLNTCIDVSRLFARGARGGPLRGLARALVIAWGTFPALTDAVRAVSVARRLRGERGAASLIVPVLERTIERAVAVAAAMEVRGFAARHPIDGDCATPVEARDTVLAYGSPDDTDWRLGVDELVLAPGTLSLVAGPTGSGKSTLLHALSGLFPHVDGGIVDGVVRVGGVDRLTVPPRDTAGFVGVVLQNPRLGFASETVADEIGFALDVRGVAPVIVADRVREIAEHVGISHLVGRDLRALSAGEATLVAIAAALVERPTLLLVDEPLADLDRTVRTRVVALLDALAHEAGVCVVVAEHRLTEFAGVADASFTIDGWRVRRAEVADGAGSAQRPARSTAAGPTAPEPTAARMPGAPARALLAVRDLDVTHGAIRAVLGATFAVEPGEIVALSGPNGAGKSTLLTALALAEHRGAVTVDGADLATLAHRARRAAIALVPDASDDLLFARTVADECRRADRTAARAAGRRASAGDLTTADRFVHLVGGASAALLAQHPRDLSSGQRRCLALAIQLAAQPRVLLVDEPTRGLDGAARGLVASALRAIAASGRAVVIATHDQAFAAGLARRVLPMHDGVVDAALDVRLDAAPRMQDDTPAEGVVGARGALILQSDGAAAPSDERTAASRYASPSAALLDGRSATLALVAANLVGLAAFAWPLIVPALPSEAQAAAPVVALALAPMMLVALVFALDGSVRSTKTLAMLGTLTALAAAVRIAGTGVGGVEAVFVVLILAGRAFGARFGLLLGVLSIALSTTMTGGFGPWTPFQMFACAWVGAGAGLLPRLAGRRAEIAVLAVYGVTSSYAFGLVMNLWFWPFAVGAGSGISYAPGAPLGQNLGSFLLYSLVTSTASWDTIRAITSVAGLLVAGPAALAALRRAKLPATPGRTPLRRRSTSPPGDGTRTRPSTARGAAAAPR